MSDSSPKLRSPLAAYGPIVACIAAIGTALVVLFTLGNTTNQGDEAPITQLTPDPKLANLAKHSGRMGAVDPVAARAESKKLMKTRGLSWFDLKPEEQARLDRLTYGSGRNTYEALVEEERSKNQKK